MIKVGIIGAEKPDAGEILRLLINHPEVDIKTLYSAAYNGRQVSSCHHGFLGESIVDFSDKIDLSSLDIVFIADDSELGQNIMDYPDMWPGLRIVDISPSRFASFESNGMEYGLSETNRKNLVRGARLAMAPSAPAALALIALNPLALNHLIESDLNVDIAVPKHLEKMIDSNETAREIGMILSKTQPDFNREIKISIVPSDMQRSLRVRIMMKCPLAIAEVDKAFMSVYDDHSFVITSLSDVGNEEVEGTHKCVVSFSKPGAGLLEMQSVGDFHMRGGAGAAVHILNLFFALDEKIGLKLKPSCFAGTCSDSMPQSSWFA